LIANLRATAMELLESQNPDFVGQAAFVLGRLPRCCVTALMEPC